MAKRTTGKWEALLGRWVYDKQPDKLLGARERFAKVREQEKAAPEVVAEVVRLRRELEELRALYIKADYPDGDDWEKGKAHAYRRVLSDLTRILEGGNDG